MQKHLTNAYNMMENVFSSFGNLGRTIENIKSLGSGEKEKKELE